MHLIKLQIITEPWLHLCYTYWGTSSERYKIDSLIFSHQCSEKQLVLYLVSLSFFWHAVYNKYMYIVTTGNNFKCNDFFLPISIIINKANMSKALICALSTVKCQ